jgi:hypothetical protein
MSTKAIKKSEASASKKAKADRLLRVTRGKASNRGKRS